MLRSCFDRPDPYQSWPEPVEARMDSFGAEDDDRESGGSPDGSSDNDQDGPMEDRDDEDLDGNGAPEADADGEGEIEEENEDEDDEQDQDDSQYAFGDGPHQGHTKPVEASQASSTSNTSESLQGQAGVGIPTSSAPTSHPKPSVLLRSPSPTQDSATSNGLSIELPKVRPEVLTASVYDIVPTIAAPHSTSINSITATPDLRWVFTGGADGYIRKFNWLETANGKSMLTVAQRHPFVDSVTKAGVLMSYWDNTEEPAGKSSEESSSISSVYSLAVQREGLWLLSGLESGGINLQSVRHDEGRQIACLRGHTSAVSVLDLGKDEKSVLSGSWDRSVIDWDLNTGKIVRNFEGSGGQVSALETRPLSSLPVPEASGNLVELNGTFSTDSADKPRINGTTINGTDHDTQHGLTVNGDAGSPADSLFGGNDGDSLFGDNDNEAPGAPSGGNFVDDDDDEFSRAIANGIRDQEHDQEQDKMTRDLEGDTDMKDASQSSTTAPTNGNPQMLTSPDTGVAADDTADLGVSGLSETARNGLPHSGELFSNGESCENASADLPEASSSSDTTFLAASFDGSLRVWDKRQNTPIAKVTPQNVPPWCMNACWSPDGNFIYAGRRNGTVDEYSLHKGLQSAERSFKLPNNSGPVSAVRAMPNGRHLICASYDILRLYDLQQQQIFKHATVPFLIVPGHRTGVVSHLYMDPTCRYLVSTAGNRGWEGTSTEVLLGYEIGVPK